jgi:predicted nucleic acid-binding protein
MPTMVLGTNLLIAYFHDRRGKVPLDRFTASDATAWARELIRLRGTDAIVTPVFIEMLAGTRTPHELAMIRAYLAPFRIVDDRRVLEKDWDEASRLAARTPRDGKPRQLVDCLIRALAVRLHLDIDTNDGRFFR